MSGSRLNQDLDLKMLEAITRDIAPDGLCWLKTKDRPWRAETFKKDQCWPVAQDRLVVAFWIGTKSILIWHVGTPALRCSSAGGHWQGHFHTRTMGMRFVQEFYRTRVGIARMA